MKASWLTRAGRHNGMAEGVEAMEEFMLDTVRITPRKRRKAARKVGEQQRRRDVKRCSQWDMYFLVQPDHSRPFPPSTMVEFGAESYGVLGSLMRGQ